MARYVEKFGGTSLADADRIYAAATRLAEDYRQGHQVVGVLSAQGGATDALLARARQINPHCGGRELDALLATGEMCSVSLCALALQHMGLPVVGLNAWQMGLRTDSVHENARALGLEHDRIVRELEAGRIVLATGFQGINEAGDLTTLGRGGSDTTAVALAAFLQADRCRIFTDVDGVYDRDPRRDVQARKFHHLDYATMLAMARSGAKVLHDRAVELAQTYGVKIEVLSSFRDVSGTLIG